MRETMERVALGENDAPSIAPPPTTSVDLRALLRGRFGG